MSQGGGWSTDRLRAKVPAESPPGHQGPWHQVRDHVLNPRKLECFNKHVWESPCSQSSKNWMFLRVHVCSLIPLKIYIPDCELSKVYVLFSVSDMHAFSEKLPSLWGQRTWNQLLRFYLSHLKCLYSSTIQGNLLVCFFLSDFAIIHNL